MTSRAKEKLSVLTVRPEDASTALQAARRACAGTVELRANTEGMIEVTISSAAEDAVRRAVTHEKVINTQATERDGGTLQRLTEVRPRR